MIPFRDFMNKADIKVLFFLHFDEEEKIKEKISMDGILFDFLLEQNVQPFVEKLKKPMY